MVDKEKFENLNKKWKQECIHLSSSSKIHNNPNYIEIIEMGEKVIPLILEELKNELDHWFFALYKITGEDPCCEDDWGKMEQISKKWIQWGIKKRYINE